MKTFNRIAWTTIAILAVFLAAHWVSEKCLAHQRYNAQSGQFAEIDVDVLYRWPAADPNNTDYLIESADGGLSWVSGPKGLSHYITIGCECGSYLVCYISYQPEHWPIDITCAKCETRYITTRESK